MNMSVLDEQSDLKAIVNYFRRQPYVDPNRIMLIGESQGGLVSALTAAQMNKAVSELVLIYPALCIPDNWNSRYPKLEDIPDTTPWILKDFRSPRRVLTGIQDLYNMKGVVSDKGERKKAWYVLKEWYESK